MTDVFFYDSNFFNCMECGISPFINLDKTNKTLMTVLPGVRQRWFRRARKQKPVPSPQFDQLFFYQILQFAPQTENKFIPGPDHHMLPAGGAALEDHDERLHSSTELLSAQPLPNASR
jgi:hypothetical protein